MRPSKMAFAIYRLFAIDSKAQDGYVHYTLCFVSCTQNTMYSGRIGSRASKLLQIVYKMQVSFWRGLFGPSKMAFAKYAIKMHANWPFMCQSVANSVDIALRG